jgi:hypothetical protein
VLPDSDSHARGFEALQIAELAGLELDDWQKYCLLHGMGTSGGKWSAFEVALVVGRQTGKSEVLVARILADLFTRLSDPRLTIFAAHEYKTAREIFLRLKGLLDPPPDAHPLMFADPSLLDQVKTIRTANGEESVELRNGRRVRFLARTSGSGRGFTGDTVLLDEAYRLNQEQMAALLPTMGARPDPQLWYASMGPFDDSEQQLAVMRRAQEGAKRMAYFGWEAPEGTAADDKDWWVRCTPSHPHRTSLEHLEAEFEALGDYSFVREKLCMSNAAAGRVISKPVWDAVCNPDVAPQEPLTFAVDVHPDRTSAAIVVADGDGRVELVDHHSGLDWLTARVVELAEQYGTDVVVDGRAGAAAFKDEWEAAGITVIDYGSDDMKRAVQRFYDMVVEGDVAVRTSAALDNAVAGAAKRTVGDAWVWGRVRSTVDVTPLVAASVAVDRARTPVEASIEAAIWFG